MRKLPTVPSADELIDSAFRKASRVNVTARTKLDFVRATNVAKLQAIQDKVSDALGRVVKGFPNLTALAHFDQALIDLLCGLDRLRQSLGACDWCRGEVATLARRTIREIRRASRIPDIDELRRRAYGRISSVIHQIGGELRFLGEASRELSELPEVDPGQPTLVIAGSPNVGKSQLVERISSARPRIASYPFTTQEILVGHFALRHRRYQVIDTPGLLDRPLAERNPLERQAILALQHLGGAIIFLLDPTEGCGYTRASQEHLLAALQKDFSTHPWLLAENKADLEPDRKSKRRQISALTGQGVAELVHDAVELIEQGKSEPLKAPSELPGRRGTR